MSIYYVTQEKCNYCGEAVTAGSKRCPYCGSLLDHAAKEEAFSCNSEWEKQQESSEEKDFILVGKPYDLSSQKAVNNMHEAQRENKPLGNGKKVFITIISTIIPGIGQLIGVITSIILMNNQYDEDKRSFGTALLTASLIFFVITCFFWFAAMTLFFSA